MVSDLRLLLIALVILAVGILLLLPATPPTVNLVAAESTAFSPGGEDGVLARILEIVPPRHSFLVDLGAGDGETGSSSRNLIVTHGWRGFLMETDREQGQALVDRYADNGAVVARQGLIDPGDIEIILGRHGVPRDPDLLIIGLEANDWYVWRAIHDFRPRVVQIQYNAAFVPPQKMVIEYHPLNYWDGSFYFGASIQSLATLGERKGYELIYADSAGRNLFFVDGPLFDHFGIRDNSPLALYRGSEKFRPILPGLVWDHVDPQGHPRDNPELVLSEGRIPRIYVFDDL